MYDLYFMKKIYFLKQDVPFSECFFQIESRAKNSSIFLVLGRFNQTLLNV